MAAPNLDEYVHQHLPQEAAEPKQYPTAEITDRQLRDMADKAGPALRSAEEQALDSLSDNDIKAAMQALPEQFRMVVYYADVQGYTYAETAAILGIPHGTVMSRVSRGRQRLRIALAHVADGRGDFAAAEQRIA